MFDAIFDARPDPNAALVAVDVSDPVFAIGEYRKIEGTRTKTTVASRPESASGRALSLGL